MFTTMLYFAVEYLWVYLDLMNKANVYSAIVGVRTHLLYALWKFSLCIHFITKTKKVADFIKKKFCGFSSFDKNWINLSLGHVKFHTKFSCFDVNWIQQTTKYIWRYEINCFFITRSIIAPADHISWLVQ